jgi:hypothetical protein
MQLQTFFINIFDLSRDWRRYEVAVRFSFLLSASCMITVYFFFYRWNIHNFTSRFARLEFIQKAILMSTRNYCIINNCLFTHARLNSLEMSLCNREHSKSSLNLFVILSHVLRIIVDMFLTCIRYYVYVYNWFRCMLMKTTCVSVFRTAIRMILNVSKMLRRHLFWIIASLLIVLVFFSLRTC